MNIEEARNVLWLKSNPRPLGELLDEGYLTRDRLEWAAQWAYNAKLKQAAKILLDATKVDLLADANEKAANSGQSQSLQIGISLEKARETLWPFSPYKGQPMGALVESKQLSLKDLGYAIDTAWDEKVRRAAMALLALRLKQTVEEPVPSAGFVKYKSSGRSFSEREQLRLTLIEGLFLGFCFALSISVFIFFVAKSSEQGQVSKSFASVVSTPMGIVALLILVAFLGFLTWLFMFIFDRITNRLDKKIKEHRIGQEGEERVLQFILQALDGNWHIFRNVELPGRNKGDLDLILVGPPGIWVLEIKNFNGEYRNTGETWEYRRGRKWKLASANPSRQAMNNAVRLANFLRADNIDVFVNPVVVWANPESPLSVENPSVAVWPADRLADELGNIWQREKLAETERDKIVEKLSKLCER
jgi:hypothetical protein